MNDSFFIDTNIFVYAFDLSNQDKQNTCHELVKRGLETGNGIISFQVIQEFLSLSSRKFKEPMSLHAAQNYVNTVLSPMCEVHSSIDLYLRALEVSNRWSYSFYDSVIISSALVSGCKILYTEDLQHGQKIKDLTIVNPMIDRSH